MNTNDNSDRVLRGGGWDYVPRFVRVADRDGYAPSIRYASLGFRLARVINPLQQLSEV